MAHPLVMDNNCVKYYPDQDKNGRNHGQGQDLNRGTDKLVDSYILSTAKDFCEWSRNRGGVAQKFLLNR